MNFTHPSVLKAFYLHNMAGKLLHRCQRTATGKCVSERGGGGGGRREKQCFYEVRCAGVSLWARVCVNVFCT